MSWKRLQDKQLQERLKIRARIIQLIREFFIKDGFLEVETPILVPAAGQEPYLDPMKVLMGSPPSGGVPPLGGEGYLITSPEYAHKKLLAAGFEKTFEITRAFRAGEQWGGLHNPEFTMLEWYRARADYTKIMEDVEKMVQYIHQSVISTKRPKGARGEISHATLKHGVRSLDSARDDELTLKYQGHTIDLSSPWQRLTMAEAWQKYAGISLGSKSHGREILSLNCRQRGYTVHKTDTYEDLFFKIFLTEIEPKLGFPKPTILYEYPPQLASLARLQPSPGLRPPSPRGRGEGEGQFAERFELYIAGIELANAFSELNDAKEQRRRFLQEQKLRKKLGKEIIPLDEDFLDAVGHMPPSAGIAFGVDRFVMLLTNAARIENVLAFPARELWA